MYEGLTPTQRAAIKTLRFAVAYGQSAGDIAKRWNIAEEEAEEYLQRFLVAFPHFQRWIKGLDMGIETTYTCDRCGHTQKTSNQMWEVGFAYRSRYGGSYTVKTPQWWCRGCLEHFGLLPAAPPEGPSTAGPNT